MVRPSFIKSLTEQSMSIKDWLVEILLYNDLMCFIRKIFRFIKRLPKYIRLAWINETWDYEGIYNFIEMFLKDLKKAQEEDTWHVPHETKRRTQQIHLTLEHLDRYRNWPNYYEWPEPIHKQLPNGNWTMEYKEEDEPKCDFVQKMQKKHYDKFWKLLKKYHNGWWT